MTVLPATIICSVAYVTDADTIRCTSGQVIRLAGISALERSGRCNSTPDCPTMRHEQARPIAVRLMQSRTFAFRIYGRSGKRLVGDNPALRCALVRSGAVVPWGRYVVRYGLTPCR